MNSDRASFITAEDLTHLNISQTYRDDRREIEIRVSAVYEGKEYGTCVFVSLKNLGLENIPRVPEIFKNGIDGAIQKICECIEQQEGKFRTMIRKAQKQYVPELSQT